jgi:hypothetical protein
MSYGTTEVAEENLWRLVQSNWKHSSYIRLN